MKDLHHFIISIILIVISILTIDIFINSILYKSIGKLPNNYVPKNYYTMYRMNSDIVVIGSSRGARHYVPSQLIDSINNYLGDKLTIYNASIPGQYANSNMCLTELVIQRYKPKLIILDLPQSQLCNKDDIMNMRKLFNVYYDKEIIVRDYYKTPSVKDIVKQKSGILKTRLFLSFVLQAISDDGDSFGYKPLFGTYVDTSINNKSSQVVREHDIDICSLENLNRLLQKCKSSNVNIIICNSPVFQSNGNNDKLKAVCEYNNVPYLEIYNDHYFNMHPELFWDKYHLNDDGAHEFTALFFEQLKPYLDNIK